MAQAYTYLFKLINTCQPTLPFGMIEAGEARGQSLNTCIFWLWEVGIIIMPITAGEIEAQMDGLTCSRVSMVQLGLWVNAPLILSLL